MKRYLRLFLPLLLAALAVPAAFAGVDPDPDSMGIYFDSAGNTWCLPASPFSPFGAYLLLSNPTAPTSGFACRVSLVGAPYFLMAIDVGGRIDIDSSADGFLVGGNTPYPVTGNRIVLATFQLLLQGTTPLDFYVRPPVPPYGTCPGPVVFGEGTTRCCGVSSGDVNLPVATVNGFCPVADESRSFGAIKSLYR